MKKYSIVFISLLLLIACVEQKVPPNKNNGTTNTAKRNQTKKASPKNKAKNGSITQGLRQSTHFNAQDINLINSINTEFKPKLSKAAKANKIEFLKKKNARLSEGLGAAKYAKYRFFESKHYGVSPKSKMDPVNIQKELGANDAQMYKYISVLHSKNNAKNKQNQIREIFGIKKFKQFVAYRKN